MPRFTPSGMHGTSTYKHTSIADDTSGTSADVWDPAAGKRLHITGILVSADKAGEVEIRNKTAATIIAVLDFNEKKTVPFLLGSDLELAENEILEAKFTVDAATGNAYITVIGHEH